MLATSIFSIPTGISRASPSLWQLRAVASKVPLPVEALLMTNTTPSFPTLLQRFFVDHLRQQRAVSPCTVAAYRDTFKLLLAFAEKRIGKSPTDVTLPDLNADLILAFLAHPERERANSVRSRNARLSAIRVFLKYAAHEDLTALAVIERSLAVP